ncbi:MAG: transposase [Micromonosporaceae bacterium]|nr:transposase [Micromonosporaceae bacterium]
MPVPHPPEFHRRAVELARRQDKPATELAKGLGISESCLRSWVKQADVNQGHAEGLSSDEREELRALRRQVRVCGDVVVAQPPIRGP